MKLKKASLFTKIMILVLTVYAITSIVSVNRKISDAEKDKEALQAEVAQMTQSNAELQYQIDSGTDDEAIEDIARNKLGLVYPGEKIFYDISD